MFKSLLEYSKYILEKVSFDKRLFQKEYKKAKALLRNEEQLQLDFWLESKGLKLALI
tara:strand:+ start:452 stop:622 length:171 start_codon:yes stop_codon:yes gene_type:complete